MESSELGKVIHALRKEKNLSTRELANRAGMSHSYLSQIENAKRGTPTLNLIKDIANSLDITLLALLNESGLVELPVSEKELISENERLQQENKKLRKQLNAIKSIVNI